MRKHLLIFTVLLVSIMGLMLVSAQENVVDIDANIEVALAAINEVFNTENPDISVRELYTVPYTLHGPKDGTDQYQIYTPGFDALGQLIREAYPDALLTVDQVIAQDEFVVVLFTWSGTYSGGTNWLAHANQNDLLELNIEEGDEVTYEGVYIFRLEENKLAEEWLFIDIEPYR